MSDNENNEQLETTLDNLEKIVRELESGKLSLEESLIKFEQGISFYKKSKKILDRVEKKVKILNESFQEISLNGNDNE